MALHVLVALYSSQLTHHSHNEDLSHVQELMDSLFNAQFNAESSNYIITIC